MPKGKRLVTEHLENISWEVLEAYPEVIRNMIRRNNRGQTTINLTHKKQKSWGQNTVFANIRNNYDLPPVL